MRMAHLATVARTPLNGVAELHRSCSGRRCCAISRSSGRTLPQCHERRHAARFLVLRHPASRIARRDARQGWVTISRAWKRWRRMPAMPRSRTLARRQATQQSAPRAADSRATSIVVDPDALFDIHVKRIHEYKRQHLNALHGITLYRRLRENPSLAMAPRCFIFAAKPAGLSARQAHDPARDGGVAEIVNSDPVVAAESKSCSIPISTSSRRTSSIRGPICQSKSRPRQGSLGHGHHEIHDERRGHDGTLDGANVLDPRRGRTDNFSCLGSPPQKLESRKRRAIVRATTSNRTKSCAPRSTSSAVVSFRVATVTPSGPCWRVCHTPIRFSHSPTLRLTLRVRSSGRRLVRHGSLDADVDSQHAHSRKFSSDRGRPRYASRIGA